jgi:hypothetical protein
MLRSEWWKIRQRSMACRPSWAGVCHVVVRHAVRLNTIVTVQRRQQRRSRLVAFLRVLCHTVINEVMRESIDEPNVPQLFEIETVG